MFKLKYRLLDENTGDGGDATANTSTSTDDKNNNNSENNNDDFTNLWYTDSNAVKQDETQPAGQQPATQQLTPEETLQAHIDSKNLLNGMDYTKLQNPEMANVELNKLVSNVYTATMQDASEIMTQQIDSLREEIQKDTTNQMQGNKAIEQLNTALPYTLAPEFKPVADGVFNRILNQDGMTVNKAIELTGKYFNKLQSEVDKTTRKPPSNNLRNKQVFNQGNPGNNDQSDVVAKSDWMSILAAK